MGIPPVIAVFGPTAIGKTSVAIALAGLLAERGEDAVAINCDSIQVYDGLEVISGAPSAEDREALEHRLVGFVPIDEEFSAGRFGARAREEIDGAIAAGRRPKRADPTRTWVAPMAIAVSKSPLMPMESF